MKSVITSKFQTTIPKAIREGLKLSIHDTLDWEIDDGKVILKPVDRSFLNHRNTIKVGKGDIEKDITSSKLHRTDKFL